jgi:DNA-binding transcriptional LysR family regulator
MQYIHAMNLSEVDLNLFLVLHTVLKEGSATRAAARLHVTQSAVSNALIRLRRMLGDPLVVRTGRGLVATPRAIALTPLLDGALEQLLAVMSTAHGFEPSRAMRRFTIACSDAVEVVLLPSLASLVERLMPMATLRVVTIDRMVATNGLANGEVDLLVGIPPVLPAGCSAENVYEDDMVCVVRRDHPGFRGKTLTLDAYVSHPHVEVALFGEPDTRVDQALARVQRARRIAVMVSHFSAIPMVVSRTSAIATLSRRLAMALVSGLPLRILKPPISLSPLVVRQIWHARATADEGTRYMRQLVRDAVAAPSRRRGAHGSGVKRG